MTSLYQWISEFYGENSWGSNSKNSVNERLGQAFCNDFIKGSWPELYYQEDDRESLKLIADWVYHHQYYEDMPQKLR